MEYRTLGKTDLKVSRLGFGGARIGHEEVDADQLDRLMNTLLDNGVTFLDTSACYNNSEELIGMHASSRRDEFVLATKCGHVHGGATGEDWTKPVIAESVDRSLQRMKTDHVDLLQIHSCSADILRKGEVVEAVKRAQEQGKTRYIGYSGDGENALEAIRMGVFSTLQTSFNLVDQKSRLDVLPAAVEAGMGIIAKRPIANGSFRKPVSPYDYANVYWDRGKSLELPDAAPENPIELSLRFTLSQTAIDTAIVGTVNPEHVLSNVKHEGAGPLPADVVQGLYEAFDRVGREWKPQG